MQRNRFPCKLITVLLLIGLTFPIGLPAGATESFNDHIVINQVYGGGGKGDTRISHSFIELYNPTEQTVDLKGWTVAYDNNDGAAKTLTLQGAIPAGGCYLVKGIQETQSDLSFPIIAFAEDGSDCDIYDPTLVIGNKDCRISLLDADNSMIDSFGRGSLATVSSQGGFAVDPGNKHTIYARTGGLDTDTATDFTAYNFHSDGASVLEAYRNAGLLRVHTSQSAAFRFAEDYARVGEPLTILALTGTPDDYSYIWKVGTSIIQDNTSNTYTPVQADIEKWISVEIQDGSDTTIDTLKMYCSLLPVIYIDTEGGQAITSKEYYINADMHIQGSDLYNSDNTTLYTGKTEIKGRGNTTWTYGLKKPYKLKLDTKTNLFGMGANKHWVLIANYFDRSLMRDKIAYDFSNAIGADAAMESTWVDLVLNGEYVGNYRLTEHVRVSPDRVNIFDWEDAAEEAAKAIYKAEGLTKDQRDILEDQMTEDLAWITTDQVTFEGVTYNVSDYYAYPENTGGFLLNMDSYDPQDPFTFQTNLGATIQFNKPEFAYTNDAMWQMAQDQLNAFGDAVFSKTHYAKLNGKDVHYSEIFEMDSLLDYFMTTELYNNYETGRKSTYFYKDLDGLFQMGPIWDMDWAADGWNGSASAYDIWQCNAYSVTTWWYRGISSDPYFVARAQEKYWMIRDKYEDIIKPGGIIDTQYAYLKESAHADNTLWEYTDSFEFEVNKLKTWLTNRINWFDTQFATLDTTIASIRNYTVSEYMDISFQDAGGKNLPVDTTSVYSPADAYSVENEIVVCADIISPTIETAAFYVNGIYAGTASVKDGRATISLSASDFDSDHINVVEVMGYRAGAKQPSEKNYSTLRQAASAEPTLQPGDVNGDNRITPADITLLRLILANKIPEGTVITEAQKKAADIDGNGRVMPNDITYLRRMLAGKIPKE